VQSKGFREITAQSTKLQITGIRAQRPLYGHLPDRQFVTFSEIRHRSEATPKVPQQSQSEKMIEQLTTLLRVAKRQQIQILTGRRVRRIS
jgi:hypothetical protein